ncbi:hypothetical protein GA0115243_109346 [Streptomyces sp. ScaeMP-e83]|nr:hypothetical protein GA0115243_109346 [Streptomyces sp. ScaeMP-e83]
MIKLSDIAIFVALLAIGGVLAVLFGGGWQSQASLVVFGIGGGALVGTRIRQRRE